MGGMFKSEFTAVQVIYFRGRACLRLRTGPVPTDRCALQGHVMMATLFPIQVVFTRLFHRPALFLATAGCVADQPPER